jgi:hypothetical protein
VRPKCIGFVPPSALAQVTTVLTRDLLLIIPVDLVWLCFSSVMLLVMCLCAFERACAYS